MDAHHKILKIKSTYISVEGMYCFWLVMDCPVQPEKIVVTDCNLQLGEVFDPHFSNESVIARFQPSKKGWEISKKVSKFDK